MIKPTGECIDMIEWGMYRYDVPAGSMAAVTVGTGCEGKGVCPVAGCYEGYTSGGPHHHHHDLPSLAWETTERKGAKKLQACAIVWQQNRFQSNQILFLRN